MHGNHVNPLNGARTSAAHMLASLMDFILPALKENEDDEYVIAGLTRVMERGTGAQVQRRLLGEGRFKAVLSRASELITG